MGCTTTKEGMREEDKTKMKQKQDEAEQIYQELQDVTVILEKAKQQFFMEAQLSDMNMSIKQIPLLVNMTYKVLLEQKDEAQKKALFSALSIYSKTLLTCQNKLPGMFNNAEKTMNEYFQIEKKKKKVSESTPPIFDNIRSIQQRLKVVAYDLEVPDILLEKNGIDVSIKLTEQEQERLNTRLASVINCLAVSEKLL